MIYVLFALIVTSPTGTPRPVTIVQEFGSERACDAAKESIRSKVQNARIDLLTCEKK